MSAVGQCIRPFLRWRCLHALIGLCSLDAVFPDTLEIQHRIAGCLQHRILEDPGPGRQHIADIRRITVARRRLCPIRLSPGEIRIDHAARTLHDALRKRDMDALRHAHDLKYAFQYLVMVHR